MNSRSQQLNEGPPLFVTCRLGIVVFWECARILECLVLTDFAIEPSKDLNEPCLVHP